MKRLLLTILISCGIIQCYADEQSDELQKNALSQLESLYAVNQRYLTFNNTESQIPFPKDITTTLSTNWDFVIFNLKLNQLSNKNTKLESAINPDKLITIDRVAITIDGVSIGKSAKLVLKQNEVNKYYFADAKLNDYIRAIGKGYTVFGAYESINADHFKGFSEYRLKPIIVTYAWHVGNDSATNISKQNLFIIMGKK